MTRVSPRLRSLAGLAVASVVLLTGCGAVPDLNPGVAVRVDDDTVSTRDRRRTSPSDYCRRCVGRSSGRGSGAQPLRQRAASPSSLALRSAADAAAGRARRHRRRVVRRRPSSRPTTEQLADLDEAQRDAVIEVGSGRDLRAGGRDRRRPRGRSAARRPTRTRRPPARRRSSPGSTTTTSGSTRATASRSRTGRRSSPTPRSPTRSATPRRPARPTRARHRRTRAALPDEPALRLSVAEPDRPPASRSSSSSR